LGELALHIITADGERQRFALGEDVILVAMRPGENRWVEFLVTPRPSRVRERLPITVEEIVDGRAVNGFTLAVQLAGLEEVIRANARSLAWQLRRIGALFQRTSTRDDGKRALRFADAADPDPVDYVELIRAQRWLTAERVPQLTPIGDPLGLELAWRALSEALDSGDPRATAIVHSCVLAKLDASLTMLQKARGDTADIVQVVRWQMRLYETDERLADLEHTAELLEQSKAFLVRYRLGEAGPPDYPVFVADLLEVFRDTAQLAAAAGADLAPELQRLERPSDSTGTQGAHRDFLLALDDFLTGVALRDLR
jgi:hypothetical protein